jgi:hypothetical protein
MEETLKCVQYIPLKEMCSNNLVRARSIQKAQRKKGLHTKD